MFAIIGFAVVIGAIVGGYLMEHGKLGVLMQPAELVIIGGAALGTLLIANPLSTVIKIIKGILGVLKGSPYTKAFYLETLKMLNELFMHGAQSGHGEAGRGRRESAQERGVSASIRSFSPIITRCISSATPFAWPSAAASRRSIWTR